MMGYYGDWNMMGAWGFWGILIWLSLIVFLILGSIYFWKEINRKK